MARSEPSGGIFEIRNVLDLIGRLIGGGGMRVLSSTSRIAQERSAIMLSTTDEHHRSDGRIGC